MGDGSTHADREPGREPNWDRVREAGGAALPPRPDMPVRRVSNPAPPDLETVLRRQGRLEIMPDEAVTNVSTYPAAYRIAAAHEGGHFVTVESAGPPRLFGQIVFAGDLAACLEFLGRKLSPPNSGVRIASIPPDQAGRAGASGASNVG